MYIRSIFVGSFVTILLVAIIAVTRLMKSDVEPPKDDAVEIQQYLPDTPEPPLEEPEEEQEQETSEEISDLAIPELDLLDAPQLDSPALPVSTAKFIPDLSRNAPLLDRAPAPLPKKTIARTKPKKTGIKTNRKPKTPKTKPKIKKKPPVAKSYYSAGELDAKPRETRQGRFTWPRGVKAKSGTVRLTIEIDTRGRVRVINVLSASDSKLVSPAKRLARMSRYTAPRKNGKAVKARFTRTYKLIKPR